MSTQEQQLIAEFREFAAQGFITAHELDWCLGAIRNRHGLTPQTRHQLRDTVQAILNKVPERFQNRIGPL